MRLIRILGFIPCIFLLASCSVTTTKLTTAPFGKTADGDAVEVYTMVNKNGVKASVMTYGALLTELHIPGRNGKLPRRSLDTDAAKRRLSRRPDH